jgi:hypothetical protein
MKTLSKLKIGVAGSLVAAMALTPAAASASASASETRSSAAVTRSGAKAPATPDRAESATSQGSTSQGPRDGFPDNRGIENARERANDNAAFKRNDSQG